jgi:hypothetical protein
MTDLRVPAICCIVRGGRGGGLFSDMVVVRV